MIGNLKEIEKQLNQSKGNTSGRINNPIAAAFTHRLAVLLKNSQFGRSGAIDSERRNSARKLKKVGEDCFDKPEEELKASPSATGLSKGNEGSSRGYMSGRFNNSGVGEKNI